MATFIATGLGAITALLALIGLYGVQTQVVARRTRELGIRFALGATSFEVERMVLMEGYRPVVEGIVLGLLLGTMVRLLVRAFFIDIQYADPIAIVLVAVLLLVVAFAACYIPARRAGRLLPSEVLRQL
jgi:ABC-type lipoprotein release transport system permease subunit